MPEQVGFRGLTTWYGHVTKTQIQPRPDVWLHQHERANTNDRRVEVQMSSSNLPATISIGESGRVNLVSFPSASHVFLDFIETIQFDGTVAYCYEGVVVTTLMIPTVDGTAVFYEMNQSVVPLTTSINAAISRHFTGCYVGYWNYWASPYSIVPMGENRIARHSRDVKKWCSELPTSLISGEHHIHFNALEVYEMLLSEGIELAWVVDALPADSTTSFAAGVLMWIAILPDAHIDMVVRSGLLDVETMSDFGKIGKQISIRAKSLQNLVPLDLKPLFEIDVLVNRILGEVNWRQEYENRINPDLADLSYVDVYNEAMKIFTRDDATKEKPASLTWEKFFRSRWQWSAAGSVHSQYEEDMGYVSKERELKNKFIALSTMPDFPLSHFLNREPGLMAWGSVKYEWNKLRAIYGTDLTSYLLAHFAFYNCEDTLPNEFPVGQKARTNYVRAKVSAILQNRLPMCLDFEDFNSQHSIGSMQAVIEAYHNAYKNVLSDEQKEAIVWTYNSLHNMRIVDNLGTRQTYNANGTLLSGWRLTTFINSVLNHIYTTKILKNTTAVRRSVHNGDDVLLGLDNWADVQSMLSQAKQYNIRVQPTKCAYGGLAEFLRIDHYGDQSGQYITRNIATLMHSRIESKKSYNIIDMLEALEARLVDFITRDGHPRFAAKLRHVYYTRKSEEFKLPISTLYEVKKTHRVNGGIADGNDASVQNDIKKEVSYRDATVPPKLPGVQAYAEELVSLLHLEKHYKRVKEKLVDATLKAVMLTRTKIGIVPVKDQKHAVVLRGISGAYKEDVKQTSFGKAKLVGMALDVLSQSNRLSTLAAALGREMEPMKMLSIWT
jgi:hypothetical protein